MSRFFVAMFVGQQSPQRPHRRLQHGIAWPTAPTAQPARPSASYWEGRSQFHCAGVYTAAVEPLAQSHGAGRTKRRTARPTQLTRITRTFRGSLNFRFAPKATELLRHLDLSQRADFVEEVGE